MPQGNRAEILDRPVLIVGSPRSGTSFLGNMLNRNPTVSYLGEPRIAWKLGNERRSDVLRGEHATPEVAELVRSSLSNLAAGRGGVRLVDKTPQNALRLEFVERVLPDCRVLHMIRDGRSAVLSIRDYWLKHANSRSSATVMRRLKEIDWRRAPYYLREGLQRFLPRRI